MLKSLFINPPDIFSRIFPAGLSQIISVAKRNGIQVKLLDLNNHSSSDALIQETVEKLLEFDPDMLCLTGFSLNIRFIKEVSSLAKQKKKNLLIVGGGAWCWWSPEFALRNTDCDVVINGEGDIPFDELCRNFPDINKIKTIKGLSIKVRNEILNNGAPVEVRDLDSLPTAEYELFNYGENYVWKQGDDIYGSLLTGRGCIGRCIFCTGADQPYRKYSHERIIEDIIYLKSNYNVNYIRFKDSLTLVRNKWSREFLHALINADLNIKFEAVCRVDSIDEENIALLKKAGCHSICLGIESADDFMLQTIMKKKITVRQINNALDLCKGAGIIAKGCFLVGLPGESLKSLYKTFVFATTKWVVCTDVTFPSPFPGTAIYELLKERGVSDEDILLDPCIVGASYYSRGFKESLLFLNKYNYSSVSPYVLIIFQKIIFHVLDIKTSLLAKKYQEAILKVLGKLKRIFLFPFKALLRMFKRTPTSESSR